MSLILLFKAMTWEMWMSASFTSVTWISCVLILNHLPRNGRWVEKIILTMVGIGSFGVSMTPFYMFDQPTLFELCMRAGVGLYAVWLAEAAWRELPGFNRRRAARLARGDEGDFTGKFHRRGYATEEGE